jgi:uncharacterized protein with von Willebrand factor type A (vWA) domain
VAEPRDDALRRRQRWRLVLGADAEGALGRCAGGAAAGQDAALAFLYDREVVGERNVRSRRHEGGLGESQLNVPAWINAVQELFPRSVVERLEHDALDRYGLLELVTDAEVLERATPNVTLLKAVLATKHLMDERVLAQARRIIRVVVEQLRAQLAEPVRSPFLGALDRRRPTRHRIAGNFDAGATIRRNLKRFDPESGRIVIEEPLFSSRVRRQVDRWQVVVLVDQSGSMADNVIHAAVTASIFASLGSLLRTHLVAFDTNVVDLTDQVGDPVEALLKVQLGGGTDIGQALRYAEGLVDEPRRAIVVLVSDFVEGGERGVMLGTVKRLADAGVTLLALGALSADGVGEYDDDMGRKLSQLGAQVGAMTPDALAQWVAERVRPS